MHGAGTMLADHGSVPERSIAFVLVESVDRKGACKVAHHAIPMDLCEDRSGGNAHTEAISRHDRCMWQPMRTESISVNEKVEGLNGEPIDGTMHGIERGLQDVHVFDTLNVDNAHMPGQCQTFDLGCEEFSCGGGKDLGVGKSAWDRSGIEDDGGCDDRSCQRTTSGLVDTGNDVTMGPVRTFVSICWKEGGHKGQTYDRSVMSFKNSFRKAWFVANSPRITLVTISACSLASTPRAIMQ
jgi:hypothetical protein